MKINIGLRQLSFKVLFMRMLLIVFFCNYGFAQSDEDFSREEFIEMYEQTIKKIRFSENVEMIQTYYLLGTSFVEGARKKENLQEVLHQIINRKGAKTYRLVESKIDLSSKEKMEYLLNKMTRENFFVAITFEVNEEVRLYQCIYKKKK